MAILICLSTMLALRETFSHILYLPRPMKHKLYAHLLHPHLHWGTLCRHRSKRFRMFSGIVVLPKILQNLSLPMLPQSTIRQLLSLTCFIRETFGDAIESSRWTMTVSRVRLITLHKFYQYRHQDLSGWILESCRCPIRFPKACAHILGNSLQTCLRHGESAAMFWHQVYGRPVLSSFILSLGDHVLLIL